MILGPDPEGALRLDHLIKQLDVDCAVFKAPANLGHEDAVRLVRALAALLLQQLDHILTEFGTDEDFL